jgi:hypothetical protein
MEKYKQRVSEDRALKKYLYISLGGRSRRRIGKEVRTEDVQNAHSSVNINALRVDRLNHKRLVGQMQFIDWR